MSHIDIQLNDMSVMIGMPTHRDLPPKTVLSLITTFERCYKLNIHCELGMVQSGVVNWGRDDVIDSFMKSSARKLFWIDSDMTWTPDQFIRLLALSKLHAVVGASYVAKTDRPTFFVKYDQSKPIPTNKYGMLEVEGLGLGFTVVDRDVIEDLVWKAPKLFDEVGNREIAQVFRTDSIDGKRRGEDMAFFADIRALGYKVHLDPEIDLGHVGIKEYRGSIKEALQAF